MAAGPFEADLAAPFGPPPRNAGARLIQRLFLYDSQSGILMPREVAWMIARGLGAGAYGAAYDVPNGIQGAGGPSAAFAGVAFNPGARAIAATVAQVVGSNTSLSVGGVEVLRAASATEAATVGASQGTPGQASACIGDVKVSGSLGALTSAGNPGTGGDAPQEPGANLLMPKGLGGQYLGRGPGFGAGGAGGGNTGQGAPSRGPGGPGLLIIEFWSDKP